MSTQMILPILLIFQFLGLFSTNGFCPSPYFIYYLHNPNLDFVITNNYNLYISINNSKLHINKVLGRKQTPTAFIYGMCLYLSFTIHQNQTHSQQ